MTDGHGRRRFAVRSSVNSLAPLHPATTTGFQRPFADTRGMLRACVYVHVSCGTERKARTENKDGIYIYIFRMISVGLRYAVCATTRRCALPRISSSRIPSTRVQAYDVSPAAARGYGLIANFHAESTSTFANISRFANGESRNNLFDVEGPGTFVF